MHLEENPCPRLFPVRVLSRKWSYLTLRALSKPMLFSELQRELKFITNHILTRELKLLQAEGLIAYNKKYSRTQAGEKLIESAEPLMMWSVNCTGRDICPPEKKCSTCITFPKVAGARVFR
jgi:DNA-binding HxlR family transcriptional regulator